MPLYEYACPEHVTERLRKYEDRDDAPTCHCGQPTQRIVSRPHCPPDGVYSYAPNIGSADAFERRREAIKAGRKVVKKSEIIGDG